MVVWVTLESLEVTSGTDDAQPWNEGIESFGSFIRKPLEGTQSLSSQQNLIFEAL